MSDKPPPYDFGAADQLRQQLAQLKAKLEWLIWLRQGQRQSRLGAPGSHNWTGPKRHDFEGRFHREQAALHDLAGLARTVQSQVETATSMARAARQKTN